MAKTLFGTSDKSNFILNMDLDKYRAFCARLMLVLLWVTAASEGISQLTEPVNGRLAEMAAEGGFSSVLALLLVALRSVATIFSIGGVAALITMIVGLMRKQVTKAAAVPYLILAASLAWGVVSMLHSFSIQGSVFGQDGRDEGWVALLFYASMFYLGTMLRRKENIARFFRGLMIFGIFQCVWAILQAQPFFEFPNAYRMVDPLLYQDLRLPCGLTDSPVTFAMLLALLLGISIPGAMLSADRKNRILSAVCAGLSMLLVLKTQTFAGLIACGGAVLLTVILAVIKGKKLTGAKWAVPVIVLAGAVCSFGWSYVSPALNHSYMTANDEQLENGYRLYDGGILYDDGNYRLSVCGPYSAVKEHDFDIYDAASVLKFARSEGIRVIKKYPVLGTGPDNFWYMQLHSSMELLSNPNTVDRPYDDYLFIAATRGIPSLLLHLVLLGVCAYLAWQKRKGDTAMLILAAFAAALIYSLTAFVGISVLTVAPLYWMLLGILAGTAIEPKQPREKQPKRKQVKE